MSHRRSCAASVIVMAYAQAMSWTCSVCRGTHEGLPTGMGWAVPDVIWDQGQGAVDAALEWSSDLAAFEGRWVVRGVLEVPFQIGQGFWSWGIWAEVPEQVLGRIYTLFDEDGSDEPRLPGLIANAIPGYLETVGLPIEIQLGDRDSRPSFTVRGDQPHPLAREQNLGLDDARIQELATIIAS